MKKSALQILMGLCLLAPVAFALDPETLYRNTIPEEKHLGPVSVQSLTDTGMPRY